MQNKRIWIYLFLAIFLAENVFAVTSKDILVEVRNKLPFLKDSSIGVIDAEGKYTKGSGNGLNCSGFAKWIIDGFYYPLSKNDDEKYLSIQKLRKKHPEERGTRDILAYEDSRDPYFGLDWTRNLAVELGKKRGENPNYKTYDVTDSTISNYVMNCGYSLSRIESVLLEQEKLHPGRIYLGSINGLYGNKPRLWQHYHVVVFIPYYENSDLKIAVLERNKETSFDYLLKRYPRTYCHLVEIPIEGEFELMNP